MQVTFKYWKLCDHSVCDEWIIESLKVMSQLGRDIECLGVKEAPYWDFVAVDNLFIQYFITKSIQVIFFITY